MNYAKTFGIKILRLSQLAKAVSSDYNDSRENPLTEFYGMYGGRIGYVVEITG